MIRREIPELYGHLPVELFVTPSGHYAFDASQVAFLELDRITFDILTCLRQEHCSVEELAARLPEYEIDAIVEALAAIEAAQALNVALRTDETLAKSFTCPGDCDSLTVVTEEITTSLIIVIGE